MVIARYGIAAIRNLFSLLINNIMALQFDSILLSAAKTGNPPLADSSLTSLSADGVNILTLSANDVGIAYNAEATLTTTLGVVNVQGSTFSIDTSYDGETLGLVKSDGSYTTFAFASAWSTALQPLSTAVQPTSTFTTANVNVSTPNTRRLYLYGYR